ncbi:MAG TPA: NADH-quinone oxidoreductase subunit J [Verrucomicrobiae bacterium]|nr:NADH-quinone oxidoreductase subunit J [Verrucomicrobiae bacterium]
MTAAIVFWGAALVAIVSTVFTVTGRNPVHALLYLIVSLLAVAVIFFTYGAPFAALLEVIVYAGAILVLFVFVVMMLNLGDAAQQERKLLTPRIWVGPGVLSAILLAEVLALMHQGTLDGHGGQLHAVGAEVTAKQVGIALFGPYLLAVELASMLLLGALVAAYHLGRQE